MTNAFLILVFLALLAVILVKPGYKGLAAICSVIAIAALCSWMAVQALTGYPFSEILSGGAIFGDVSVRVDALSAWFMLLTNFTAITGILYGRQYLSHYKSTSQDLTVHYSAYVLNHAALTGIFAIRNSLAFLCTWEIMALSAFMMVIFEHGRMETLKAGINYLIQSHISIVLLTLGFIWAYAKTGSFDFQDIFNYCSGHKEAALLLFLVFFAGFGIKAGFVPFHTWLPHAHPAAPSHVSGLMSGVIIKSGIYGIMRIVLLMPVNKPAMGYIILAFGVISGVYGVMLAIIQHNLKRLLAYHSIENIGIIGIGIGIGTIGSGIGNSLMVFAGYGGALLHTLNHSLFKSLLFFTAGNVYHALHTLTIDRMGGLIRNMPKTASLFLLAALAICGLPPFNGFVSEFLIYSGLFHAVASNHSPLVIVLAIVGLALIGGLAVLCFTKAFGIIFLGNSRTNPVHPVHEENQKTLFPLWLIGLMILAIGLFPRMFMRMLMQPLALFDQPEMTAFSGLSLLMQHISLAAWGFILLTAVLYFIRQRITRSRPVATGSTWGCGYDTASSKLQYTASSFVKPYVKIIKPIVDIAKTENTITGVIPEHVESETHFYDKMERKLIDWPVRNLRGFLGRFRFLQNGSVQFYVLYGVVFIIICISIPLIIDGIRYLADIIKQL